MPNESISQMSAAALPLTGAELVPLVQNGGNVQAAIANLATGLSGQDIAPATITATSAVITAGFTAVNIAAGTITASTAVFTASVTTAKVTSGDATFLHETSVPLTDGAAAAAGTLTNAPVAGDPTKWIAINDNGVTRFIPTWS